MNRPPAPRDTSEFSALTTAEGQELNRWLLESLDAVATLVKSLQSDPTKGRRKSVFTAAAAALARVMRFHSMGFAVPDASGLEFRITSCEPSGHRSLLETELTRQIDEGNFGWAISQNRAVVIPLREAQQTLILHVLATPTRVLGMFLGIIDAYHPIISDAYLKLISIIVSHCASILQGVELQQELTQANEDLEQRIEERTLELRKSQEAAQQANKAKDEFLATMSHEIRTPLNGIIGTVSLLREAELAEEPREYVELIEASSAALLEIVNEILDFSKIQAGKVPLENIPFNLYEICSGVAKLFGAKAEDKGVRLTLRYDLDVPDQLLGDPGRLRQVITNLTSNAIKFTKVGSVRIDVICERRGENSARVRVSVKDTGIGIPEHMLERIFDRFTQADASTTREYGGTGLGLSVSRQLIELMGGEIGVRSELEVGSIFWFNLELSVAPDTVPSAEELFALTGARVLLVQPASAADTEPLTDGKRSPLRCTQCHSVADGIHRLREAQQAVDPFAVVILDEALLEKEKETLAAAIAFDRSLGRVALLYASSDAERSTVSLPSSGSQRICLTKPLRSEHLRKVASRWRPRPAAARAPHATAPLQPHAKPGTGLRVLVVDDNRINQRLGVHMLEALGCAVDVASDGLEAVERVSQRNYAIIFMDCQMPELDGYQATARIRDLGGAAATVPIVALTANALPNDRERCLQAGMNDFISKPFRRGDLHHALEKWLYRDKVAPKDV